MFFLDFRTLARQYYFNIFPHFLHAALCRTLNHPCVCNIYKLSHSDIAQGFSLDLARLSGCVFLFCFCSSSLTELLTGWARIVVTHTRHLLEKF